MQQFQTRFEEFVNTKRTINLLCTKKSHVSTTLLVLIITCPRRRQCAVIRVKSINFGNELMGVKTIWKEWYKIINNYKSLKQFVRLNLFLLHNFATISSAWLQSCRFVPESNFLANFSSLLRRELTSSVVKFWELLITFQNFFHICFHNVNDLINLRLRLLQPLLGCNLLRCPRSADDSIAISSCSCIWCQATFSRPENISMY